MLSDTCGHATTVSIPGVLDLRLSLQLGALTALCVLLFVTDAEF